MCSHFAILFHAHYKKVKHILIDSQESVVNSLLLFG